MAILAVAPLLSVTISAAVPAGLAVVGVPEIIPAALILIPAGNPVALKV